MLSIERIKELLDDDTVTAGEAEQLRDASRAMAEILYKKWSDERSARSSTSNSNSNHDKD